MANNKHSVFIYNYQGAGMESDNFQVAVLMNYAEYNEHKISRSSSSLMSFNIHLSRLKLHLLCSLTGMQYIPVIVIAN